MDRTLLDTDTLSEILKGKNETVVRNAELYLVQYQEFITSAVTVAELSKGFHKKGHPDLTAQIYQLLATTVVIPLDNEAGLVAGKIFAELERAGRPIGWADPLIAGIAITNRLSLATGNARHYEQVIAAGFHLTIVDWRKTLS